jgi:hypothetical protein
MRIGARNFEGIHSPSLSVCVFRFIFRRPVIPNEFRAALQSGGGSVPMPAALLENNSTLNTDARQRCR